MASIPAELVQGCTLDATIQGGDYPASGGWSLAVVFYCVALRVSATVAADGADFSVTLTAEQTLGFTPGAVSYQAFASKDGARHHVESGVVRILPDLNAVEGQSLDPRSFARRMLESYNQLFLNVSFVKTLQPDQIAELERVRKQLEWDVKREDDAERLRAGGYPTRKIFARFA